VLSVANEWSYVPELITQAQAAALHQLLAIDYEDALNFEYMYDAVDRDV
jgi:hypothetical protein